MWNLLERRAPEETIEEHEKAEEQDAKDHGPALDTIDLDGKE